MSGKSRRKGPSTARRVETATQRDEALRLRLDGKTYSAVGAAMGVDRAYAHRLVQDAIAAIPKEAAEQVLAMEMERLDAIFGGAIEAATGGDPMSARTCLAVMDRRAKYLGLDKPAPAAPQGPDMIVALIAASEELRKK